MLISFLDSSTLSLTYKTASLHSLHFLSSNALVLADCWDVADKNITILISIFASRRIHNGIKSYRCFSISLRQVSNVNAAIKRFLYRHHRQPYHVIDEWRWRAHYIHDHFISRRIYASAASLPPFGRAYIIMHISPPLHWPLSFLGYSRSARLDSVTEIFHFHFWLCFLFYRLLWLFSDNDIKIFHWFSHIAVLAFLDFILWSRQS